MKETPIDYQSPSFWSSKQDLPTWSKPDDEKGEGKNRTTGQDLVEDVKAAETTVTKMTIVANYAAVV